MIKSRKELEEENVELKNELAKLSHVLTAVVKSLGRVRVDDSIWSSLQDGDHIFIEDDPAGVLITFEESNMVVPGGVTNGQANVLVTKG